MPTTGHPGTMDLFADGSTSVQVPRVEPLAEGARVLRGFATVAAEDLWREIGQVVAAAPLRQMVTPGGLTMSVAMTNCGARGWVTDRWGYRYAATDPLDGRNWPAMPTAFAALAGAAAAEAGYPGFAPDACLINRYEPGARLSLHQDRDEQDFTQPIVSVSLGLPATFFFGGLERSDAVKSYRLDSGDVVVWGGPARLAYHGVRKLKDGEHPMTGKCRINLTFRKAL